MAEKETEQRNRETVSTLHRTMRTALAKRTRRVLRALDAGASAKI